MDTKSISSYEEAKSIFKTARNPGNGKPLMNNTRLFNSTVTNPKTELECGVYTVRLHSTHVVAWYPQGFQRLRTGGWNTITTKDRLNRYSNAHISQKSGDWIITTDSQDRVFYQDVLVDSDGEVILPEEIPHDQKEFILDNDQIAQRYSMARGQY